MDAKARAARIKLVAFDIDGVMTDGGLHYTDDGHELKTFNVQDGLGIVLLKRAGIAQTYAEPVYGTADVARSEEPVVLRSPLIVDRKKPRDVLLGRLEKLVGVPGAGTPFARAPGFTLGLVSLLSRIKQFPALFSILAPVLASRPQVRLEVFGNGGYGQIRHLKRALAPLRGRTRFWGFQANVAAIYPQLDYLMTGLPEKEALGLNAIEAQACGCPVFTSDLAPMNEIGSAAAVYVDPRDPVAMARAIREAAPRFAAMREGGLANAAHYSAAHMASRYVEQYREVIAARQNAPEGVGATGNR